MRHLLPAAAVLAALAVGACVTKDAPPSKAAVGKAQIAEKPKQPWWRLSQYSRKPAILTPDEQFERRKGLFGEIVLYRKGEANSSASTKPSKVRR